MGAMTKSIPGRLRRRLLSLLLMALSLLTLTIVFAPVALAEGGTTPKPATSAPPALSYAINWPIFLLCVVLVVGFYIFLYVVSFKEFKKVIDGRFGPRRLGGGG
jgi:hypothetical protein